MANYMAFARSNYFEIENPENFLLDLRRHGIAADEAGTGADLEIRALGKSISLLSGTGDGWPDLTNTDEVRFQAGLKGVACLTYEPLAEDDFAPGMEAWKADWPCRFCQLLKSAHEVPGSFAPEPLYVETLSALIARHLCEGSVAVLMTASSVGARSVGGAARAVNSKGEIATVDLEDIWSLAKGLGSKVESMED